MRCFANWLNMSLAGLLAGLGLGCQTFKDDSLTCNLWQKDPTGSIYEQAQGGKYVYSPLARTTLTPLAVVGDATLISVGIGVGLAVGAFADAWQEGAQNGGRTAF
jgi:hypothetical protein